MQPWPLTTPADYDLGNVRAVVADHVIDDARVVVRDGMIVDVGRRPRGARVDADGDGLYLIPGLVDVHSDTLNKESRPRPGAALEPPFAIASTATRLRAAGITTAFHGLAYQERSAVGMRIDSPHARDLAPLIDATSDHGSVIDHRILHRLDHRCPEGRSHLEERLENLPGGELAVVSYEDHTPGQGQYADPGTMQRWLETNEGMAPEQAAQHVAWWKRTRTGTDAVRDSTLGWLADLVHAGRIRLWGHDPATREDIDTLVGLGGQVAEFPTTRVAAERARASGLTIVAGAPNVVRGRSHAGNVSATELATAGLVDALASDYLPTAMLSAAVTLAGALSLPRAIGLVTGGPARAAGLEDRGELAAGRRADLVLTDLSSPFPSIHWVGRARLE